MILSPGSSLAFSSPLLLVLGAVAGYALAALPADNRPHLGSAALAVGWVLHLVLLLLDIAGVGQGATGARLGFAPVLSATVWLVIGVHTLESRLVPLPSVRKGLAVAGVLAVLLAAAYPGDMRQFSSPMGPLHFVLGVASYGLFGAAVLHGLLLDAAERRLKQHKGTMGLQGMPLLQLERITFRFVEAGFAVLTATLVLGLLVPHGWRLEHKTVFSLLGWAVFAALLLGRRLRGWRGRRATRWLYVGAVLLLLAYVGSRFVLEVVLRRAAA